jgi:hypothetical protein
MNTRLKSDVGSKPSTPAVASVRPVLTGVRNAICRICVLILTSWEGITAQEDDVLTPTELPFSVWSFWSQ